ncbi:hypothetical protein CHU93_13355 [Sandarakinorhabdus cyanobacteriorum]|uniref:DUF1501 domain-containing protein n=1 Tax=Sandarakinorhabdus cyanobacteriorum TaxID=1981098 RepID=A0A255Y958_9SPHN|nr:DUF1501 domain-containing protein [Sandarakinorhabdus cyanobacteriorum]OYQ25711.1 hypothetical protein CHU93_13355 [Sandarakinorhabdus cyanobacteriorum]
MIDRRSLIARAGMIGGLALHPGLALAAATTQSRLVFIILRGAMDGLAAISPANEPRLLQLRGALARPPEQLGAPLPLTADFTAHPALAGFAGLFAAKEAAVVHAVASPYRERSHFDAQNILETGGNAAYALKDGWLNRLLPLLPPAPPPVAISAALPTLLQGAAPTTSFAPSRLPDASASLKMRVAALYEGDPLLHRLWGEAMATEMMAGNQDGPGGPVALAATAARLLAQPAGPRIAVLDHGGWDTHAGQAVRLAAQLRQLDTMIATLKSGLGPAWADTLVICATEFGRTVAVNGTNGTDHGTASAVLLAGGRVAGGRVHGDWPGLTRLFEDRDLLPITSLNAVLAGSVAGLFGLDPDRVVRSVFATAPAAAMAGLVRA